ncbi:hypothetical protein [Snodgrassella communis]|uniref:Uncharacterized protein n=1 Tax=Snodgrassella alvi TaxID=1196083 RepID=A0A2N9XS10_9NEIS|nr:hypothetical protein [Snodgrassella communis]PIT51416.1 hypothetical protein BHC48_03755 [Snodgrassella communis]
MAFKNLYELLKLKPTATPKDIAQAMKNAAQNQMISLDDLKQCKQLLLNEEARKKYNARLYAEYPEILIELTKPKEPEPAELEPAELETPEPVNTAASKKKRYIFISAACAVVIAVIGGVYFKYYKPISDAKEAVKDILKDPDSAKFYNVKRFVNSKSKIVSVCGKVNAKVPAGGYGGKQPFVYLVETKEAVLIPDKRPESIVKDFFYSTIYRINCLNADPDELSQQSAEAIVRLVEYEKLANEREATSIYDVTYNHLGKKMKEMSEKMEKDKQAISIYSHSDDE